MVLDYMTDSAYMGSEFKEWEAGDGGLPSHVSLEDPRLGRFEIAFRIDEKPWPNDPDIHDAMVVWRLE